MAMKQMYTTLKTDRAIRVPGEGTVAAVFLLASEPWLLVVTTVITHHREFTPMTVTRTITMAATLLKGLSVEH
jgi:hypothetical protein